MYKLQTLNSILIDVNQLKSINQWHCNGPDHVIVLLNAMISQWRRWRWIPLRWKSKLGTNGTEAPPPHSLIARAQWGPSTAQWGPNTLLPALLPTILNYTKWPLPCRLISFVHIFVVDIAGVALDSDLYHQQTGGLCSHRYEEKLLPLLSWGKDFKWYMYYIHMLCS